MEHLKHGYRFQNTISKENRSERGGGGADVPPRRDSSHSLICYRKGLNGSGRGRMSERTSGVSVAVDLAAAATSRLDKGNARKRISSPFLSSFVPHTPRLWSRTFGRCRVTYSKITKDQVSYRSCYWSFEVLVN